MPFEGDFFDNIVNVSWSGGLWLAAYTYISTGNDNFPPVGTSSINVGGEAADMLSGPSTNPLTITPLLLKDDQIAMYVEFIDGGGGFSDNLQGFRLFNIKKLPSTFDANVPVLGTLTADVAGTVPGNRYVSVGLVRTKTLKRRVLRLQEDIVGFPVPVFSSKTVDFDPGNPSAVLDFQINDWDDEINATIT